MPATDGEFGQSRVYRRQGATDLTVASGGRITIEQGGLLDASGQINIGANATMTMNALLNASLGAIALPGALRRGYIPLVPVGVKTTATASGIVPITATSVNPKLTNPDITSGYLGWEWSTAAGNANPLYFAPVRIPDDFDTASGFSIHVVASGAVANATNALNMSLRVGTATAALLSTAVLGAAPVEVTMAVATGALAATGFMSLSAYPENAHASGNVRLLSAGLSYRRRTS